MPAFGAFTGGLNVLDLAYEIIFQADFHACMIGHERIYPMASKRLMPDLRGAFTEYKVEANSPSSEDQ
jgi:hypothetical protein